MKQRFWKLLLLCLLASALSGCNTFHGFGEDVSHLGNAIARAAN
ncbi:entericidin A/B family lipoprotein [Tatumella morbirosei]|nr:entericidin A/B family lipoprotein [Tatumella morbirosei]